MRAYCVVCQRDVWVKTTDNLVVGGLFALSTGIIFKDDHYHFDVEPDYLSK